MQQCRRLLQLLLQAYCFATQMAAILFSRAGRLGLRALASHAQQSSTTAAASLPLLAAASAHHSCRQYAAAAQPAPIEEEDDVRTVTASSPVHDDDDMLEMKGIKLTGRPLYLDMQATTPIDPRVIDAMLPYFTDQYGNPHSRTHMYGWETEEAVELARKQVASLIGADPKEIIFTSGATEANNLAIKGVANFYKEKKNHIITLQTDHKCVLDSCRYLQHRGFQVTYLPVKKDGLVDLQLLADSITPQTVMVSVMMINNEIGVIQPTKEIGKLCRERKVFFHSDAAQAVGKIPINVNEHNIDLMSISGHKIYGPKGVGAVYVRRRPRVRLEAQMNGGGQERGIRSGTVPASLAVGLGKACEIAQLDMAADTEHIRSLAERLHEGIKAKCDGVVLNGPQNTEQRYVGNMNLSFSYVEGESLIMGLKDLAVSSGSACTSASLEPSYVLRALGVEEDMAHTSLRFGLGRFTTAAEVDRAVELTVRHVNKLREMSPLWELVQEGVDLKSIQWSQH